jgi:asparagine synthase (glutamine-hydrolysing)
VSGLAAACGKPKQSLVGAMMSSMAHRGSHASGIYESDRIILAQNYLRADNASDTDGIAIPVRSPRNPNLAICYDGQMGNWAELASIHQVPDGPFREERLLLNLYEKHGEGMLDYLDDAIFTLVITDGQDLFVARDLLGIKTLFYAWEDGTLYLASELKGILQISGDVYEFPNGYYRNGSGCFSRFAALPESPPEFREVTVGKMARDIRNIIERSFDNRIDFSVPTGGLLSGGMDSSVINYIGSQRYKEKFGPEARMNTFALGVGESNDIHAARIVAKHIDSEHHELIVDLKRILEVLPEVIYYLESFDPSLVRSSVPNYLISQYAHEHGIEILLSGEGGDEVFCGYTYLRHCPTEELFSKQMECIGFLHNNASLRLDRMNQCHSIRVVAPLISGELLRYSMAIPPGYKQKPQEGSKVEKWIFRKAYEELLPSPIVWRSKQEFSQGSGSAGVLPAYFEEHISDYELAREQVKYPFIRSLEELYYFRIFKQHFGSNRAIETVGQWLTV